MNITNYLDHPEPEISERAKKLQILINQCEQKLITQEEYEELIEDLLDIQKVLKYSRRLITKVRVEQGLKALLTIARSALA